MASSGFRSTPSTKEPQKNMAVVTLASLGLAAVYVILWVVLYITQDAKEPPLLMTTIPFVSPVIGMIQQKTQFYARLKDKYELPIYTLRLPFSRIYIINATELIPAMQRQWRTLSFAAFIANMGPAVELSEKATKTLHKDLMKDEGFSLGLLPPTKRALELGQDLDNMNQHAVKDLTAQMDKLTATVRHTATINLWEQTYQVVFAASTNTVFGPQNPYQHAAVAAAWKIFEPGMLALAFSPFPKLVVPKAHRARALLIDAMREYLQKGGHKSASKLVRARYEYHIERYGFSLDDFARAEVANTLAVVGSMAPCAFWVVFHILSDEKILADVRRELLPLVQEGPEEGSCSIGMTDIQASCPIFLSTFQEVMRYRSRSTAVRVALEDVLLDGQYLLKKGSLLMVPAPLQHMDVVAWGNDVHEFDHMRFVRKPGQKGPNKLAFRALGGGHDLCPGRHFATTEILSFAAMMVLRYDVAPVSGQWAVPPFEKSPMTAQFPIPDEDINLNIRLRDNRKWRVTLGHSAKAMGIVSEDSVAGES